MARVGEGARSEAAVFVPTRPRRFAVAGALAALFAVADRLSKAWVLDELAGTGRTVEVLPGIVGFRFAANTGAAFSLGEGYGWVFVLFALVMVAAALWYLASEPVLSAAEVAGLGMVVGGAVGNAIDRVALGYVVDFIACEFIDFPVFNVADIGVTVGVAVTFIGFALVNPANRVNGAEEAGAAAGEAPGADAREDGDGGADEASGGPR